jgi:solute carrier family 13 (sodium-dependent dicarboxylate transporter), member 2/3/5
MATETRENEREEIEDVLSEAEERFERRRRTVGLFLGPVVLAVVLPIPSETTSNTASAAIVVPIAIAIAASADVDPTIPPALAAIFGANYGFMLPVSTPPNAIVYSSGMLPITRMIKAAAVFDIIGIVLCVIGVVAMANLVGLA